MKKEETRVGEKILTSEGYWIEIIEYLCALNCTIQFEDGLKIYNISYRHIRYGNFKNPYHTSVQGMGYFGVGSYNSQKSKSYMVWANLFQRCYNKEYQEKYPTYKGCSVDPHWHNFQNFAAWFEENYIDGFELDKDILVKGNKIYSSKTCCFVPREINAMFKTKNTKRDLPTGVSKHGSKYQSFITKNSKNTFLGTFNTIEEASEKYREVKESYVRELAEKWKDKLTTEVYNILINYKN